MMADIRAEPLSVAQIGNASYPAVFERVLDRLRQDLLQERGCVEGHLVVLAYEDRRFSHLLRATLDLPGHPAAQRLFLKVYKCGSDPADAARIRQRVEKDFLLTRSAYAHLARWPGFSAARPLACYADELAIATEEVAGETLLRVLERSAAGRPSADEMLRLRKMMFQVGGWVRAFQTLEVDAATTTVRELTDYVDLRLQRLATIPSAQLNSSDSHAVLDHLGRLGAAVRVEDLRLVAIHADLAPSNVLVSGGRIVVLDFAMASRGTAVHDLTRLFLQLDLLGLKPGFRRAVIRDLQSELLRGFDPALDEQHPLFRMLLMRHHINHLTTLVLKPERFPRNIYNRYVQCYHRRWIAREVGFARVSWNS